jgi:trigger factor
VTLTIHTEEDSQRQLKVTVEVPEDRVQSQMRRTARQLGKKVNIPGFRRGKVPYSVIINRFGEPTVRADAVEDMLESLVIEAIEAIEEVEETPYRQPTLDDMEIDPLVLEITIPLAPRITLGDYRAIRREIKPVEVTEEALERAVEHIRSHRQILEQVDRPAEEGDMVTLSGTGKIVDGEEDVIWREENSDLVLDSKYLFVDSPFVENVVGMSVGDEKEFTIAFPEDYEEEELSGREVIFEVSLLNVQSRELPELTDELAQEEGDYETVEDLMAGLEQELHERAERQVKSELFEEVLEEMVSEAEIAYPPVLVKAELDDALENLKSQVTRSGWQWDDYLKLQAETEESLREQWQENTVKRVRRGLILRQFVKKEQLTVDSADIDLEVEKRLSQFGDNAELQEQLRSAFTQSEGLETMTNDLLMEKVQERIEEIVSGNAPDLEALDRKALETAEEEE